MAADSEVEDVPSTSSDDEYERGRIRGERKYYKPSEDSATSDGGEEGSEAADTEEENRALTEPRGRKAASNKYTRKKARVAALPRGLSTAEDLGKLNAAADEDEDLQRALALSLASPDLTAGNEDPAASEAIRGRQRQGRRTAIGNTKQRKLGDNDAEASPSAAERGHRRFASPCSADVSRAFQMLDPRGTGTLDPYALRDVASKLLHKELSDEDINALMEYAEMRVHQGQHEGLSEYGAVDVEGFQRLVAHFCK